MIPDCDLFDVMRDMRPRLIGVDNGTATTSGTPAEAMTLEKLREAVAAMNRIAAPKSSDLRDQLGNSFAFGLGMGVHQSPLAVRPAPNRVHKHRRGQTKAYHARIQKKWTKRFGTHQEPCAYIVGTTALFPFGAFGKAFIAHPSIVSKLQEEMQR